MRYFQLAWILFPIYFLVAFGNKDAEKTDQSPIGKIKRDIFYLASDKTEGRLTGTNGEQICADYIESRFRSLTIAPFKAKYKWDFVTKMGLKVGTGAYFNVFDQPISLGTDIIVLPYGTGNVIRGAAYPGVFEDENCWLVSLKSIKPMETNNPQKLLYEKAKEYIQKGAESVVFLNDIDAQQDLAQLNLQTFDPLNKPVLFMNHKAWLSAIKPNLKKDWIPIDAKLGFEDHNATGKNIAAWIDNKAPFTIIIAATHDHIGYLAGKYNGADNNASSVAALLSLAEMMRGSALKKYNYLFLSLSGSQQDFLGAKSFLQQNESYINSIAACINLHMVGRLNSAREIFIKGFSTSPSWSNVVMPAIKGFSPQIDSTGFGYNDANAFYEKNIPMLNISTGYHEHYLKTEDVAEKINFAGVYDVVTMVYKILTELEKYPKPMFQKTNDIVQKLRKVKNDMGVIPDLAYNQDGVRVAACQPNKTASKAGMQSGDVIVKFGAFKIYDIYDFEEALRKTEPEREVAVVVKRGKGEFKFFVVL